jgi:uroporphyrinogen-III synthase
LSAGPLSGLRVLLTRPAAQAEASAAEVRAAGGVPLVYPCLEQGPPRDPALLEAALGELLRFRAVLFTSQTTVRCVAPRLRHGPAFVAAVGAHTARALAEAGLRVDLVSPSASGAGLAQALLQALPALPGQEVLFLRAEQAREELVRQLTAAGVRVTEVMAYEMREVPAGRLGGAARALRDGQVDLVPLASPRTAAVLLGLVAPDGPALLRRTTVGALGPTTAAALAGAGVSVDVVGDDGDFFALVLALARAHRLKPERGMSH